MYGGFSGNNFLTKANLYIIKLTFLNCHFFFIAVFDKVKNNLPKILKVFMSTHPPLHFTYYSINIPL